MLVKVEDLRKGDVILAGSSKGLYEAKLLRQPVLAKQGSKTTWYGTARWTTVLCAVREETTQQVYNYVDHTGATRSRTYSTISTVVADGKDYTREKRIDLTDKELWLIKRETP
jgi:hypothetical protein